MILKEQVKVILADKHQLYRIGFKAILKKQKEIILVGEADTLVSLVKLVENSNPHVIMIDTSSFGEEFIIVGKQIKNLYPKMGIVVLSYNKQNLIKDFFNVGANSYLSKTATPEETLTAVIKAHQGKHYSSHSTSEALFNLVTKEKVENLIFFSQREKEVIILLCDEMTAEQIASKLHLSSRTVEDHLKNIRQKVRAKNMIGIALYAVRNNLV